MNYPPVTPPIPGHIKPAGTIGSSPPTKPPARSIFTTRTAFANALLTFAGALGTISPDARDILAANAPTILLLAGIVGMGLRYVTHGRVTLFGDPHPTD